MGGDRKILYIMALGLFLRLAMLFAVDLHSENYWEYGEIAKNLLSGRGYSLFYVHQNSIELKFSQDNIPQQTAYMPPIYVLFLLSFLMMKQIILRNILLIATQSFLGTGIILMLYKYVQNSFSNQAASIAALLYAVLPEFIYSVISFTPTILFQALLLLLLLLKDQKVKFDSGIFNSLRGGILVGLMYCRSEMALFAVLFIACKISTKKFKEAIILASVVLFLAAPWTYRNYLVFHRFIPLTTNGGFNFYRGNNSIGNGDWGTEEITSKIIHRIKTSQIDLAQNDIYWNEGKAFWEHHGEKATINALRKTFDYWLINIDDSRALRVWQIVISLLLFITFAVGLVETFELAKYKYEYTFFCCSTIVAMAFFVLPRYQTTLHTVMLPFCAMGIQTVLVKRFSDRQGGDLRKINSQKSRKV